MEITPPTPADLDKIRLKLKRIYETYTVPSKDETNESYRNSARIGFLVEVGKCTEAILKYICKNEDINPLARNSGMKNGDGRPAALNDYIQSLREKNKIDPSLLHELDIIKKWRNWTAHDVSTDLDNSETVRSSTVDSVHDSLKCLVKWFFNTYLKIEQPSFESDNKVHSSAEKNVSTDPVIKTTDEKEPAEHTATKPFKPASVIPGKKKFPNRILFTVLITAALLTSGYFGWCYLDSQGSSTKPEMTADEVYSFLERYQAAAYTDTFNVHNYFANTVFYKRNNRTPEQIKNEPSRKDSRPPVTSIIDKSSLSIRSKSGGVTYWQVWIDFTCFRPSISRYQRSKMLMEFGINSDQKITAVRELQINPNY